METSNVCSNFNPVTILEILYLNIIHILTNDKNWFNINSDFSHITYKLKIFVNVR